MSLNGLCELKALNKHESLPSFVFVFFAIGFFLVLSDKFSARGRKTMFGPEINTRAAQTLLISDNF